MSLSEETKAAVAIYRKSRGWRYRQALAFVMAERKAAEWNRRYPVGTAVTLEIYLGGPKVATATRSEAWALSSGGAAVLVDGRTGCYGLEWLTVRKALTA